MNIMSKWKNIKSMIKRSNFIDEQEKNMVEWSGVLVPETGYYRLTNCAIIIITSNSIVLDNKALESRDKIMDRSIMTTGIAE